ncbi:1-(5-phosphoribosyl)-5-[(5-phosphoribosylamino)methylideneamino]imidazole-4-carboxamide isomerase [Paremcibacter congregatus]|uniref:1-(5-phosphoribosyl)-5-[(5-phosphoribosylamino)methylideneamino] imidazole-4-carboxamide isomerase n=1 Tax=Paremcibacter congregatus TaxID=2043170 RepID=A0A2G4YRU5_9PROT|nr:1-(5-phosphoribosyl)-5-[(5-phosphoribosylamino)methylideneamino]imidazole-4-carboxamide isomerase [Paremcibacter congregatus]PHZ85041.1 1-(5-phosphoribosyl)-5-[(5-phosphoribosylamino)methylideneamino]imidazole-4-carboxamide isomerase [Paremcibacter congregatus]QDE25984.1 1-(5-phosphoribosyl)-5-[(5-phosphoribosylamino)methylideneamino]imidazole-4-carboxamide isomerase [Paremcibacter congregatus]
MLLYPAIDLKDGQCVRLFKGEMDQATVFNDSPADQAVQFQNAGCEWLHLVDLNGAFAGKPVNGDAVEAILKNTTVPAQLGGGIRDLKTIETWLDKGLQRVILGTIALRDPALVVQAAKEFAGHVAVGIDARGGMVAVEGWAETSDMSAIDLGRKFEDAGISAIIYTDIDRDGTMQGVNVQGTVDLAQALSIPVIASGGVSCIEDLEKLKTAADQAGVALDGAISGRALYDGRLDIAAAIALLKGNSHA